MNTYCIDVAQTVRSYGFVKVNAESAAAAVALVDSNYVFANFAPHGHGADDYGYENATGISLTSILRESFEGDEESSDLDVELPDPWANLSYLSEDEAKLIVFALLNLRADGEEAPTVEAHDAMRLRLANRLLEQLNQPLAGSEARQTEGAAA